MIRLRYQHENIDYDVLTFQGAKTTIHEPRLRDIMSVEGIVIPHAYKLNFNNQGVVKLGDPLFQRAFKEIYYPLVLDPSRYIWTGIDHQ